MKACVELSSACGEGLGNRIRRAQLRHIALLNSANHGCLVAGFIRGQNCFLNFGPEGSRGGFKGSVLSKRTEPLNP
jgi:hypothetical protein